MEIYVRFILNLNLYCWLLEVAQKLLFVLCVCWRSEFPEIIIKINVEIFFLPALPPKDKNLNLKNLYKNIPIILLEGLWSLCFGLIFITSGFFSPENTPSFWTILSYTKCWKCQDLSYLSNEWSLKTFFLKVLSQECCEIYSQVGRISPSRYINLKCPHLREGIQCCILKFLPA